MGFWNKKEVIDDEDEVSFKVKCKRFFIKLLIISVIGLIYAGIGYFIAYLVASRYDYKLQDAAFTAGCLIVAIGLFSMMHGNPNGTGLSSWGSRSAVAMNHWLMDVTLQERNSTDYYKDFRKHAIVEFTTNRFSFLSGGIFLLAFSILFL